MSEEKQSAFEKAQNFRVLDHDSCNNCNHARVLTGWAASMWQCSLSGLMYGFSTEPPSSRICDEHER
jgi:hypothetical protein